MSWSITNSSLTNEDLLNIESLFSLGNGYLGVRGNFEEHYAHGMKSIRGTYVNAFHEVISIPYGEKLYGFPDTQQKLVNGIDAQTIRMFLGDDLEPFNLFTGKVLNYERTLHLDQGFAEREIQWESPGGKRISVHIKRLVSFTTKELFAINLNVHGLNFDGPIHIESTVNGDVENYTAVNDPRVASGHAKLLTVCDVQAEEHYGSVVTKTDRSELQMSCVTRHTYTQTGNNDARERLVATESGLVYSLKTTLEQPLQLTKWNVYTDTLRHGEHVRDAGMSVHQTLLKDSFDELLIAQKNYLQSFWYTSDLVIEGDASLQAGIRFNVFQLLQSAGQDAHSHISAKGLSGEGYEGHYFWDTEIYMIPVFLLSDPKRAKHLLLYRYAKLDQARERAKEMGHKKGALYPWRTISGTECSSFFPSGTAQYHISGDIAYSYIQYYLATEDHEFMKKYGTEVLFETARIWMEIGHEYEGAFHIDEVTGPDEYTCCVNNNYYTNAIAQHNLNWAAKSAAMLKTMDLDFYNVLCKRLGVNEQEIESWADAAERMLLPYDETLGINPQDDTFLRKKVWDFAGTPADHYPLLLHYHPLTIYRYQVCKQADTVLSHFLLEDTQTLDTIRKSFDYYESITTHDSSLSSCIFSIMAAKVGYTDKAYEYFVETARLDLDNTHGNTKDGLHLANMGGTWMAIVHGFAGVRLKESGLYLKPTLPKAWTHYAFKIRYKNHLIDIHINEGEVQCSLLEGEAIALHVYGEQITLTKENKIIRGILHE